MNEFSKEQIEFMKNASDHVEKLYGGKGYGKTHQLIKEMEDKINKLEKENQQLKKQKGDVVELIIKLYQKEYNKTSDWWLQEELCNNFDDMNIFTDFELERMLGENDE